MPEAGTEPSQPITLLCLDVDGVMTDGRIVIDDHGTESKRFHVRDGWGLRLWLGMGGHVAIITGRSGMALRHRAEELGIQHVIQGSQDKAADYAGLLNDLQLIPAQGAVLCDDLPDLPLMRVAGYPMAVADAATEVIAAATWVTKLPGGHGAVREAVEHLLKMQGRWDDVLALWK
jgi:YrbI family 3-deoxy-D-manno-octulosonate 8-phosphate phosphatase